MHRTLRSALRAGSELDAHGINWELLIHIDSPTPEMQAYITANQDFLVSFPLYRNSFKDLSASRNFMVGKAKGTIITFLDADDIVSESWLLAGVTKLQKLSKPAVLHTEWLINFGEQNLAWRKYDSRSKAEDALIMVWANRWDSVVMAPRRVFEDFPYAPNTDGFGSEDWHFGSQTLAAGIPHYVVPGTALFARRKDVSEMSIQQADRRTVHYTDLLDIDYFKHIDPAVIAGFQSRRPATTSASLRHKARSVSVRAAKKLAAAASAHPTLRGHADRARRRFAAGRQSAGAARFPAWLLDEWRALHAIDRQIFPDQQLLATIPFYISEMYELGIAYRNLVQYVSKQPDYIFVIPHLVAGGADLVVLNYVRALQKLHPDWHILVITTDNTPSPWADRLPEGVDYMPWGKVCVDSGIWQDLHLQLFARLIVQLRCKRLHIIQSALGFAFAAAYTRLLRANDYTVYACAFCEDIDDEGRFIGHIHSGLPAAYPALDAICTDNAAVADQLAWEYGLERDKFVVHYQPAEINQIIQPKSGHSEPLRILWASRVSTQKRPDLLKRIAQKLNPVDFAIDAYGSLHNDFTAEYFDGISALTYQGSFSGLQSIDLSDYDVFLYTSANDGVPNVLLGIAAAGLPIVASAAGGVGEFIKNNRTGLLIEPIDDIDAYVQALHLLKNDPGLAHELAVNAQQLLQTQHGPDVLEKQFRRLVS